MSIKLWQVVLPRSRAFDLTINKTMRRFFEGLTYPDEARDSSDKTYNQLNPQLTENLVRWEEQFYLPSDGLTEQQRRDKLEAAWKMTGGESPAYLQSILRGYGFDVYVHDWWKPDAELITMTMGGEDSFMGGENAYMGAQVSEYPSAWNPQLILVPPYYPLVNKISSVTYSPVNMGSDMAFMGGDDAYMGKLVLKDSGNIYPIPSDPDKWRYFYYIAGETMPNQATVPLERKNEFEELILAIFPAHMWGGIIVEYV